MTETHELRIAVIGAGPAGVYSSDIFLRQLKKLGEELGLGTAARIDLFEKLPVPFGLVRYGVAPDHPSIKFIASALEKTLDNPDIHLYCDVEFGKDVTLDELLERYDAVLFATGASKTSRSDCRAPIWTACTAQPSSWNGTTVIRPALANGRLKLRKSP